MEPENELIAQRREKLEALRARGVEPFGRAFETSGSISEVRQKFKEGDSLRAAGRITAHRDMGKSHFVDLRDATGRIQAYFHEKEIGAAALEMREELRLAGVEVIALGAFEVREVVFRLVGDVQDFEGGVAQAFQAAALVGSAWSQLITIDSNCASRTFWFAIVSAQAAAFCGSDETIRRA